MVNKELCCPIGTNTDAIASTPRKASADTLDQFKICESASDWDLPHITPPFSQLGLHP